MLARHVSDLTGPLKHFVYLVGLHVYYKMTQGPYNIKLKNIVFQVGNMMGVPKSVGFSDFSYKKNTQKGHKNMRVSIRHSIFVSLFDFKAV